MTGINIRLSTPPKTYAISGRAVDEETGKPVTGIMIWQTVLQPDGRRTSQGKFQPVDPNGEFRLESLKAGKYGIAAGAMPSMQNRIGYSEETIVDVIDDDVRGVDIRVKRGTRLSGITVVEPSGNSHGAASLEGQMMVVMQRNGGGDFNHSIMTIDRDGRFQATGLHPGKWLLRYAPRVQTGNGFMLLRIERDGVPSIDEFEIKPDDQAINMRVVFGQGNGVIRGSVAIKGGTLPETAYVYVTHNLIGSPRFEPIYEKGRTDARGNFAIDSLVSGQYELEAKIGFVAAPPPDWGRRRPIAKQTVTISNGQTIDVVLTIDLKQ